MTVEEAVHGILTANSTVIALCPSSRILVPGDWQNIQSPYIIHFPASSSQIHTHGEGLALLRIYDFYQVSIFAASYSGARALADAVIAALDGYHSGLTALFGSEFHVQEHETRTHHLALNFRIAYAPS